MGSPPERVDCHGFEPPSAALSKAPNPAQPAYHLARSLGIHMVLPVMTGGLVPTRIRLARSGQILAWSWGLRVKETPPPCPGLAPSAGHPACREHSLRRPISGSRILPSGWPLRAGSEVEAATKDDRGRRSASGCRGLFETMRRKCRRPGGEGRRLRGRTTALILAQGLGRVNDRACAPIIGRSGMRGRVRRPSVGRTAGDHRSPYPGGRRPPIRKTSSPGIQPETIHL